MLNCMTLLLSTSVLLGQADGAKVFKSYTDLAVGGVWTTTIDNEQLQHSYRRVNKKFVQIKGKGGILPFVGIIGVDPETQQCTWWFFNDDGGVGKDVMTQEAEGVWILEGIGVGPKGENRYKGRITRVDANTIKEEQIEFVVAGEKQEPQTNTWTRKQPKTRKLLKRLKR